MRRIRYAARSLSKAPLLSLVVVFSLALGVGANTAIFSLMHQIILQTLPVRNPEQLVLLTSPPQWKGGQNSNNDSGSMDYVFSLRLFRELEKRSQGLSGLAAFRSMGANLAYHAQTISDQALVVSGQYFPVLRVQPLIGRVIMPADDVVGAGNAVAVLSYGYWHDRLGGESSILNQSMRINGKVFTIVGVAPKGFTSTTLGQEPAVYVPLSMKGAITPNWDGEERWDKYWLYLVGRLSPGVTMTQAQTGLNSVFAGLADEQSHGVKWYNQRYSTGVRGARLTLVEGQHGNSSMRDDARTPLITLMIASVMVLLIAMANAANLLLARSAQRRREMAIRAAIGASRGELASQTLIEALMLAVAGGLVGLFFASTTLQVLIRELISEEAPLYALSARLEWPVLLFNLGISLVTGLLFGLYPALEGASASVSGALKDESGKSSGTRGAARVRKVLVCAQIVVSAILLIPTGLFLRSLVNLFHVDLGMRTESVITFGLSPELNAYKPEQSQRLFERVETELQAQPGVRSVAGAMVPAIGGSRWGNGIHIEGFKISDPNNGPHAFFNDIGSGYFGKMGIPLMAGREFTDSDNLAGRKVAIINQEFVRRFLSGRNPVGSHFGSDNELEYEIVGVVRDSHYASVKEKPYPVYYIPWRQDKEIGGLNFYVYSALPVKQMIPQIRRTIASLDRDLPVESVRTLDDQVKQNLTSDRLVLQLAASFAILATILAMLGLYGVMAHNVTRRTREIGIRLALGARPGLIRSMVLREMLWMLGIGLLVGVPAALGASKLAESQLFGVKANDAAVVVSTGVILGLTAVFAAYWPARRASRVNPLDALRYE
jgi:predicted permease